MILVLKMPSLGQLADAGAIERVYVQPGQQIAPGAPLVDVKIDRTGAAPQDCPPISYLRVVAREAGWVRVVSAAKGGEHAVGEPLALITSTADEATDAPAARPLRTATAGFVPKSVFE